MSLAAATKSDPHQAARSTASAPWTRLDSITIALLAILAFGPRAVNLLVLDPFVDEASWTDWAFRLVAIGAPGSWFIPLLTDGRPPLFVWLMVPFGAVVDNGILAGRLAAAVCGALSAGALYGLGRELASRTVGATAAILWALSPFSVFFARIAADDALLTLMAALATWASARLARQPTTRTGALCGLTLGLAVFSKTSGVLLALAPLLALLVLGQPRGWRGYVRPLVAVFMTGLVVSAPLLLGVLPLLQQVAIHTGSADLSGRELLVGNLAVAAGWMETFVGSRFLLVAGAGLVLAVFCRQRRILFVALLGAMLLVLLLEVTTPLFSRYLMFVAFPAYLLAAYAVERAGTFVARLRRGIGQQADWTRLATQVVVVGLGLVVGLSERSDLLADIVRDPVQAKIPGSDSVGYLEQWYAVYGLGQVVDELRARSHERPVTVLVPPASRESRVLIPYAALRMYLRREPAIRVVEAPSLWRAQDLREVRRLARDGPTYLVVNGTDTPGPGMPNDVPAYTRQLERRLAQDVPEAHEVLRIPRPTSPNWLSLYRLDQ